VTSVRQLFNVKDQTLDSLRPMGPFGAWHRAAKFFSQPRGRSCLQASGSATALSGGKPLWSADLLSDMDVTLSESMRDYHVQSGTAP